MACGDPAGAKCGGTWTVSTPGVMALSESFFEPFVAGDQKPSLARLSLGHYFLKMYLFTLSSLFGTPFKSIFE